jgi:Secretion system C-terminal sorting domain
MTLHQIRYSMTRKTVLLTAFALLGGIAAIQAQTQIGQTTNPSRTQSKPVPMTVQPWKASGIPDGWIPKAGPMQPHVCAGGQSRPRDGSQSATFDPDGLIVDHADDLSSYKVGQTDALGLGRSFVANNFTGGPPADNSMAISNSGFIVSVDNTTIDYYRDTPDTLLQFQLHRDFFGDTVLGNVPYDPRVIYDRYANRFIVVMAMIQNVYDDFLLVSFSKTDDPRDGWNHYRVDTDTLDVDQWMDYPQIAINRDELFIVGNMVDFGVGNPPISNKLFQIRKQDGYDSLALTMKIWPDILDGDGQPGIFLCPLSDGLMADSYNRGIFLASTEYKSAGQAATKLFWYHLTDSIGGSGATVDSYQLGSGQPYDVPGIGYQLGSTDYLDLGNCRVQSGFHLGGKLYFVYCKGTNTYCTVVLNRVDTQSNTLQRDGWGFSSGQQDDSYPSIAFAGVDSTDDAKLLMTFQRSGFNIFPQMRAVYFDSVFSLSSMLVKIGEGYIELINSAGVNERLGDYTTTQRRYGAATPTCWGAASYPVGANGNYFGQVHGLNTYIAEFTDSLANAVVPILVEKAAVSIFPNPANDLLHVQPLDLQQQIREIALVDVQGRTVEVWHGNWGMEAISLNVAHQSGGCYFLRVQFKNQSYAYFKVLLD